MRGKYPFARGLRSLAPIEATCAQKAGLQQRSVHNAHVWLNFKFSWEMGLVFTLQTRPDVDSLTRILLCSESSMLPSISP